MTPLHYFLLGALATGTLVCGLIFLRLWRDSGDRFFLFFALSFLVQAVNRVGLALEPAPNDADPLHYWIRFSAYLLILAAIVDKNRAPKSSLSPSDTPSR